MKKFKKNWWWFLVIFYPIALVGTSLLFSEDPGFGEDIEAAIEGMTGMDSPGWDVPGEAIAQQNDVEPPATITLVDETDTCAGGYSNYVGFGVTCITEESNEGTALNGPTVPEAGTVTFPGNDFD